VGPSRELALLSAFDGIGAAALSLTSLGVTISQSSAWEVNEDCRALTSKLWPRTDIRGDFRRDEPSKIAKLINKWHLQGIETVIAAALPCPSFSRILANKSRGADSEEGRKFGDFVSWMQEVEKGIANPLRILVENAEAHEQDHFTEVAKYLLANDVVVDPSDDKPIHRPSVRWTRISLTVA
jgi:site-specific DNA-cytosine methylase